MKRIPASVLDVIARPGLGRRYFLIFSGFTICVVILLTILNSYLQVGSIRLRMQQQEAHLLSLTKEVSLPFLLSGQPAELETIFEEWGELAEVQNIYLVDADGYLMVDSGQNNQGRFLAMVNDPLVLAARQTARTVRNDLGDIVQLAEPILFGGGYYGGIRVDILQGTWRAQIQRTLLGNLLFGGLLVACCLVVSLFLTHRLVRPVRDLTRATEAAASGDLTRISVPRSGDELGTLAQSFNTMLSALHKAMQQTRTVAFQDSLTGLPNRNWLQRNLGPMIEDSISREQHLALLFVDLDWFKNVNDTFGHQHGDELLVQFSVRLKSEVERVGYRVNPWSLVDHHQETIAPTEALVARMSGDEFVICLRKEGAVALADAVLAASRRPYRLAGTRCRTTTSVGLALSPEHGETAETLLSSADAAMYQAKRASRNRWKIYGKDEHKAYLKRRDYERELELAVEGAQFHLLFQPQWNCAENTVYGVEALVRWTHPEQGVLSPNEFLPAAARAGLMPQIGRQVFQQSFEAIDRLTAAGYSGLALSLNLSVEELVDADYIAALVGEFDKRRANGLNVEIEVTESTAMKNHPRALSAFQSLKSAGFKLAIDDFGVGYSNLSRLHSLAFDTLKIDRSLVSSIATDHRAQELLKAVLTIANTLDLTVIAEGVETGQQARILAKQGVSLAQGFLFSRPITEIELCMLLAETNKPKLTKARRAM